MSTLFPGGMAVSQGVSGLSAELGGRVYHTGTPVTLTNTVTKTALGTCTLPANTLTTGRAIEVEWDGRVTGAQSTDTLTLSLELTGSVVAYTSGAIDVATNNTYNGRIKMEAQAAVGAAAAVKFSGQHAPPATAAVQGYSAGPSNVATNAAVTVTLYGQWSVAHASNILTNDGFTVRLV